MIPNGFSEVYSNDNETFEVFIDDSGNYIAINFNATMQELGTRSFNTVKKEEFVEMLQACRGSVISKVSCDELCITHEIDQMSTFLGERSEILKEIARNGIFGDDDVEFTEEEEEEKEDLKEGLDSINNIVKLLAVYFLSQR